MITFEVDFQSMELIIWKDDEEEAWGMPIKLAEHRALYPFVSLTNMHSSV